MKPLNIHIIDITTFEHIAMRHEERDYKRNDRLSNQVYGSVSTDKGQNKLLYDKGNGKF